MRHNSHITQLYHFKMFGSLVLSRPWSWVSITLSNSRSFSHQQFELTNYPFPSKPSFLQCYPHRTLLLRYITSGPWFIHVVKCAFSWFFWARVSLCSSSWPGICDSPVLTLPRQVLPCPLLHSFLWPKDAWCSWAALQLMNKLFPLGNSEHSCARFLRAMCFQ